MDAQLTLVLVGLGAQLTTLGLVLKGPTHAADRVERSNAETQDLMQRAMQSNGSIRREIDVRRSEDAAMHEENRAIRNDAISALTEIARYRRESGLDPAFTPHSDRERSA